MINMKQIALGLLLGAQIVGLSSCGAGSKIMKNLEFKTETVGTNYYTGFDALVDLNGLTLPTTTLPIYAPKDKSVTIGTLKIENNTIGVRLDLKNALKVDVLDGTLLPNNRAIPVSLPTGVTPIAFPIAGTNSRVYIAISNETLMAGVAVTFNDSNLPDLLKQSLNAFFGFSLGGNVSGNVGLFSGDAFGIGVFATKSMVEAERAAIGLSSVSRLKKMDGSSVPAYAPGSIGTEETSMSNRQKNRLLNAVNEVEELRLK